MRRETLLVLLVFLCAGLMAQDPATMNKNQLLVKLKGAVPPEYFIADFSTHSRAGGGVWIEKKLSLRDNINLIRYDTASISPEELMHELQSFPDVESVTFDYFLEDRQGPNDPDLGEQWGIYAIQADKAWDLTHGGLTARGDTIVVAVLDSGFDILHEDIQENLWKNYGEIPGDGKDNDNNGYADDVYGWNFIADTPDHKPDQHGHSVAGIIGAKGNNDKGVSGINWNIKLMLLETRMVSDIIAAYEYIIEQRDRYNRSNGNAGAFVVATNASFGVNRIFCDQQPLWGQMYDRLGKVGILTSAAAANNAWDVDEVGDMPTTCPSDFLLTVLNTNTLDERYFGSAYGRQSIDMGAPGQNSFTTKPFNQYGAFNGNSAAAPHLAGAIALLYGIPCGNLGQNAVNQPEQTALKIREVLLTGVDPKPGLAEFTQSGGRLNVFNSMKLLMEDCRDPEELGSTFTIFPNPAHGTLYFDFVAPANEPTQIRIFNALGQPVFHQSIQPAFQEIRTEEIQVGSWPPGPYYVQLLRGKEVMVKMVQVF